MSDPTRPTAPALPLLPLPPLLTFPDPIPQILPFGTVNFFAGASGAGKTIFLADWCARLRDGRSICGHATNPPTAFHYCAADRGWSTFASAFRYAGFPEIPHYTLAEDPDTDPKQWRAAGAFDLLALCLKKLDPQPGSLVIIDPVAPLFIAGDQNRARDVAVSVHWFRRLARFYACTFLCCANVSKAKDDADFKRKQDRISGSGAFIAYSDTQIYLDVDDQDIRTLGWTPRLHAAEEFRFVFNPDTHLFAPAESSMGLRDEDPNPAQDRPTQILGLFPPVEPITFNDLSRLAAGTFQIARATLKRDLGTLLDRQLVEKPHHGLYQRRKIC